MNPITSLLNSPFSIEHSAALSQKGATKSENEDSHTSWYDQNYGVFCVADGIGGAAGGKEASDLIVNSITHECESFAQNYSHFNVLDSITTAISDVNKTIHSNDIEGMGSTVAILIMEPQNGSAQVLHAGDSRIYRFRRNSLKRLTQDHSMAAQMGYEDETRVPSIIKGRITNAVGIKSDLRLNSTKIKVNADDLFLLCSDGLNRHLSDSEVADILKNNKTKGVESIAKEFIDISKERGAKDDISVVLVKIAKNANKISKLYLPLSFLFVMAIIILSLSRNSNNSKPQKSITQVINVPDALSQEEQQLVVTQTDSDSETIIPEPDTPVSAIDISLSDSPKLNASDTVNDAVVNDTDELSFVRFDENWKTFGTGILSSNVNPENTKLAIEVSWYDSQWGVGVMVTFNEPLNVEGNLEFRVDIKGEHGSGTRVYAGISTLDDANLESGLHDSKLVNREWTSFRFNISNMVKSFPQLDSRHFTEDDVKRIQILKLLFTNPLNENYSETVEIRNLGVIY